MMRSDFYFKIKSDKTKYGLLEMGLIFHQTKNAIIAIQLMLYGTFAVH